MRPSLRLLTAHAPSGKRWIGWWGEMGGAKQRGIIQYTMSPFRQDPLRDALTTYLFNGYRRIVEQIPFFLIPFATGYGIYTWANGYAEYLEGKEAHYAEQARTEAMKG